VEKELLTCTPESSRQHLSQAGNWCRKRGLTGFVTRWATCPVFSSFLVSGPWHCSLKSEELHLEWG